MSNRDSERVDKVKGVKKDYIIQYSHPTKKRIAVSDWLEKTTTINSDSKLNAIKQFNKYHQHLGTWYILDCYEK